MYRIHHLEAKSLFFISIFYCFVMWEQMNVNEKYNYFPENESLRKYSERINLLEVPEFF